MKAKPYVFICAAAAALLTCVSAANAESTVFRDVSAGAWYYKCIYQASELGIMSGSADNHFNPNSQMTRAQFVQALYNLNGRPETEYVNRFNDVPEDSWCAAAVSWAVKNHISSGISETEFGVNKPINREQIAVMLYNAYGHTLTPWQQQEARKAENQWASENAFLGSLNTVHFGPIDDFRSESYEQFCYGLYCASLPAEEPVYTPSLYWDYSQVDSWASDAVEWALAKGLFSGTTDMDGSPLLDAKSALSRAHGASILVNVDRILYNKTVEVSVPVASGVDTSSILYGYSVPVLMFHEVSDNIWGIPYLFVSPTSMREELQYLYDNGYDTIFFSDLDHLEDYDKPVIITLDDGYEGNYTELYPLLQEYNMKATIFMIADDIDRDDFLTSAQLKEMSDSGLVSIQSHTYSHSLLNSESEEQLNAEYSESQNVIATITGKIPYAVSYPQGQYNSDSVSIASNYYTFGILDRGGNWTSSQKGLFYIPRTVVPRDFDLQSFVNIIDPPVEEETESESDADPDTDTE